MRFTGSGGPERGSTVQGFGMRGNQTEFQLDGLNANAAMDEGGITIPNVDTIAEFSVETSSFSAENGRNPLQIVMATKSGTNAFHGTAWEFIQNDTFNARNAFSLAQPAKLRPQPVRRRGRRPDRAQPDVLLRQLRGDADPPRDDLQLGRAVQPAMLQGDFSGAVARDPGSADGPAVPRQHHPANRISNASRFFLPYVLQPNSPDGNFRAVAPVNNDTYQYTARVDHQFNTPAAHLGPLGDEQEHQRLARLLAGRALGQTRPRSTTSASTTPTR